MYVYVTAYMCWHISNLPLNPVWPQVAAATHFSAISGRRTSMVSHWARNVTVAFPFHRDSHSVHGAASQVPWRSERDIWPGGRVLKERGVTEGLRVIQHSSSFVLYLIYVESDDMYIDFSFSIAALSKDSSTWHEKQQPRRAKSLIPKTCMATTVTWIPPFDEAKEAKVSSENWRLTHSINTMGENFLLGKLGN